MTFLREIKADVEPLVNQAPDFLLRAKEKVDTQEM